METTMSPIDDPVKQITNLIVGFENFIKQQFHLLNTNPESVNPFSLDKTIKEFLKHIEGATEKWLHRLDTSPTTRNVRDVWVKSEAGQKEFISFLDETLFELEKMNVEELHRSIPEHDHLHLLVHEYEEHTLETNAAHRLWRTKWQAYWTQQQRYQRLVAQGITDVDKKYPTLYTHVKGDTLPLARSVAEATVENIKKPAKKRFSSQQLSQNILERLSRQYYGAALIGLPKDASEELVKLVESTHEYVAQNEKTLKEQAKKVEFSADETKQFAEEAHHYAWNKASADQLLRETANELPFGKDRIQMALLRREIAKEDARFANTNIKKLDQLLGRVPTKQRPLIDEIRFQRTTMNEFFNKHGSAARFMVNMLEKDLALSEITMDEWRAWREGGIVPQSVRSRILRYFSGKVDPATLSRYGKILDEYQDLKRLFSGRLSVALEKLGFKLPSNQLLRLAGQIQRISPTEAKIIGKIFGPKGLSFYSKYQRVRALFGYRSAWDTMSTAQKLGRLGKLFESLATKFPRFANLFNQLSSGFGRVGNFFATIEKAQAAIGQTLAKLGQAIISFLRSILPTIGRALASLARAVAQIIGKLISWLLQLLMRFIAWVAQVAIPAIVAAIATLPGWALVALVILVVVVIIYFVVGIPGMFSAQDRRRRELATGFIPGGESAAVPGGGPVAPPAPPGQYIPPGGCMPAQSSELCCVPNEGFCSLAYTQPVFGDQARNASQVCLRESIGGYTAAINDGCLVGRSAEYSVGLFQINLLVHTPAGIYDSSLPEEMRLNPGETCHQVSSTPTGKQAFTFWGGTTKHLACSIDNMAIFEHCRNYLLDPVNNMEIAKVIYEGRGDNADGNLCGWMAWTTARNVVTLPDGTSRQFCGIVKPVCEQ